MGAPKYQQTPASAGRLFALSHDLMGALDREGRRVWANPAWEVVLGRDPLKEDPKSLVNIPVERTMVGGRWVFES